MISSHRIAILCIFIGIIQQLHHLGRGKGKRRKQQKSNRCLPDSKKSHEKHLMFVPNQILVTLKWDDIPLVTKMSADGSEIDTKNYWVHQNYEVVYFLENIRNRF